MRETLSFSQEWRFHKGDVPEAHARKTEDRCWEKVVLPHCWNDTDTFVPSRGYYRGVGWYRKHFDLPPKLDGKRVFVEFDAGFALGDVWVNEVYAGQYMGGFTGFSIDATSLVRDRDNLIAIELDNSHNPDILPGKEIPDYNLYGGLYREARLVLKNEVHIPQHGISITTPSVSRESATVRVGVTLTNRGQRRRDCSCTVVLKDPQGEDIAKKAISSSFDPSDTQTIALEFADVVNPALWSPDSPNVYTATAILDGEGEVLDRDTTTFGIRWFEFQTDRGFFLNGHPLKLRGVNRHQDYPGLGNAVPPRLQIRDAEIVKEMGGNFVRASHYPQHPAFLDACDRLGILVYEEIASWQFIGGELFVRNAEAMMRETIARDKNHPSIFLWGLLNEGRSKELFERLNDIAHEKDPTRPTVYAENRPEEGKELGTVYVPDVLGINYKLPHLDEIREALPSLKMLSSEHTNADQTERGKLETEINQVNRLKADTDILEAREFMAGSALWSMHDYGTDYEPVWPIQHSGVLDCYRLPKEGYYYLKSRWSEEPMVHICGHWTWGVEEGAVREVVVLTNCERVELFLNGNSLGSRSGENPMTWQVPYRSGELKAVGTHASKEVVHTLRTAGEPAKMLLSARPRLILADGADVAEIDIQIVDASGTVVPSCAGEARVSVEGPAKVCGIGGRAAVRIVAGAGRIALRAGETPGQVLLRASFDAVEEATLEIGVVERIEG